MTCNAARRKNTASSTNGDGTFATRDEDVRQGNTLRPGEAAGGAVTGHFKMLDALRGSDQRRIANLIVPFGVNHIFAFADQPFHGVARFALGQLGHENAARLLQETLEEESAADSKLTQLAESRVNAKAATP